MGKEKIAADVMDVYPLKIECDFSQRLPELQEKQNFLMRLMAFFRKI
jgi:hypothetical protein